MLTDRFKNAFEGALEGKTAIITGAGRGIGRSVALAYAGAGANVCCVARSENEIKETAKEIGERGGRAIAVPVDVSDLKAVEAMTEKAASEFGGIDILFINHGVSMALGPIENCDPDDWRKTVEINLFGAYHCVRSATPHLKERGAGKIIIVGSGQGHQGTATTSAYSSSKAGIWALVQSVAAELVTHNISVNELLPGNVNSRLYKESVEKVRANTPAGSTTLSSQRSNEWFKEPDDVVPLAMFLACQPDVGPTAQSFSLHRRC